MSQNPKVWETNSTSLLLDLEDVETMERYETAFDQMAEEEKRLPKDGRNSAFLRSYCDMFRHLFEAIFGADDAAKIFEGLRMNTETYEQIYDDFLRFVREQTAAVQQRRTERISRYTPNRAQKRSAKKRK